jgi:cysteine desulfurase/selenocysteine lyase
VAVSSAEVERQGLGHERLSFPTAALRNDTPGCSRMTHLNAAGAALMPYPVINAVRKHLELESELGGYAAERVAARAVDDAYAAVAAVLNAGPGEIAFCDSGSRAWAMALHAVEFRPGDRVLVTETEYQGNRIALRDLASRIPIVIDVVPHAADGSLDVEEVVKRMNDRVRLVSVVHVPTNSGLINPIVELGARLSGRNALFFVDACQSLGQIPLDVRALGCDVLVGTGRKYLRAPRGTAVLFVADSALPSLRPRFVDTHSATMSDGGVQPVDSSRRFETWEGNVAAKLGMGAAARYLLDVGIDLVWPQIVWLADLLRERLRSLPGVRVLERGPARSGLVTFVTDRMSSEDAWRHLTSTGFDIDVCQIEGSLFERHVPGVRASLRASVHYYTTMDELDSFALAVSQLATRKEAAAHSIHRSHPKETS